MAALLAVAATVSFPQAGLDSPGAAQILWSPPPIHWPDQLPQASVPKEMIDSFRVAGFSIKFEETKLVEAQKRLGGSIGQHGDASNAEAWLCLRGTGASGRWISWLTSSEIGGLTWIDGFVWRRLAPNERPDRRCAALPVTSGGIVLPLSIHPGMKETEIRRIMGPPTISHGDALFYSHEHSIVLHNEEYTSSNDVVIVSRDGALWEISASRVTTN